MTSLLRRMLVSTAIALVPLASAGQAMAASPHPAATTRHAATAPRTTRVAAVAPQTPQVMYKDIIRPNGQKRSDAVYQGDVDACRQETGGSPYLPDSAAMKKCMLSYGFRFMWQRGFGSGSGVTVAGSYDSGYTPPDTSAADAASWAAEQSANDATAAAVQQEDQELSEMNASNAAAESEIATQEANDQQTMTNLVNSQ